MATLKLLYAWTASSLLLSWLIALAYPLLRRWILKLPAVSASQVILLLGLLPIITVTSVLLLYSYPLFNDLLVADHCHGDICGPHWLFLPTTSALSKGLEIAAISALLIIATVIVRQSIKGRRYWKLLQMLAHREGNLPYRVVKSDRPLAWCAGLRKPEIYISQALTEQLSPNQLKMVWAHEHCHATNRDNLRKSLVHWLTLHWPKSLKTRFRRDFSDQVELCCDLAAVHGERGVQQFNDAIRLIGQHCSRDLPLKERYLDERGEQLRIEMEKMEAMRHQSTLSNWSMNLGGLLLFLLWIIVVGEFLHPLLEFLSI